MTAQTLPEDPNYCFVPAYDIEDEVQHPHRRGPRHPGAQSRLDAAADGLRTAGRHPVAVERARRQAEILRRLACREILGFLVHGRPPSPDPVAARSFRVHDAGPPALGGNVEAPEILLQEGDDLRQDANPCVSLAAADLSTRT